MEGPHLMAYATYNDFRGAVLLMVDGDSVSSTIEPATIDEMISLGEALVHYGDDPSPLRASSMETVLNAVVAGNAAPIPADCMELSIAWLDTDAPLTVVPETDLRTRLPWSVGGKSRQIAQAGDSVVFLPPASDGQTLNGRYYAKPPALKTSLHATFQRYPELYLYAALFVSAPFLGFDSRIPTWQGYYRRLLEQANAQERQRVYAASRLRIRAR